MFDKKAKTLQVAVEYHAPHWVVLIRNAGQTDWSALRDPDRQISIQDEFGTEVQKRPAIRSFSTVVEATSWVSMNLEKAELVGQRATEDVKAFVTGLSRPASVNVQSMSTSHA